MENTDLYGSGSTPQQPLPNDTLILVFGILSIPLCCCGVFPAGSIIPLILAIVALVLANKSKTLYNNNPNLYLLKSYNNVNTGRILAIIGLILGSLSLITSIISIIMFGFTSDPQEIQERLREMMGQ